MILMPPVPVMHLTTRQIEEYLPKMVDSVYEVNNIKPENKWRKKLKDGSVKLPTPPLPGWNDRIIDPSKMTGTGKGATWLLKLQMYHILKFHQYDPETHADSIPVKYVPRNFSIDDLSSLSRGPPPKNKRIAQQEILTVATEDNTDQNPDNDDIINNGNENPTFELRDVS